MNITSLPAAARYAAVILFSILLAACGGGGGDSSGDSGAGGGVGGGDTGAGAQAPTLNVTVSSNVAVAGGSEITLTAVTSSPDPVTWKLEAGSPGRLDSNSGTTVHYIPPSASQVSFTTAVTVIAAAGSTQKSITLKLEASGSPPLAGDMPPAVLTITASADRAVAGGSPVVLSAASPDSSAVSWTLEAGSPGSLSATSGNTVSYVPPPTSAISDTTVTVTASAAGQTAKTTILLQGAQGFSLLAGNDFGAGMRDGAGSAARFSGPVGTVRDAAGNLYVADTGNHAIRKIAPDQTVTTLAGMPGKSGSADGIGTAARLTSPKYIAIDTAGNLFVTDSVNHTVRRITQDGSVTTIAGMNGVKGNDDGFGQAALFNHPAGITVDASGNLLVADAFNSLVRRITPQGLVSTFAGIRGQRVLANGPIASATFIDPLAIAIDLSGNVFVSDGFFSPPEPNTIAGRSIIRKITPDGVVSSLAGGFVPETAENVDGTGAAARFFEITGMAADGAGNLYLGDGRIRRVTPTGVVSTYIARAVGLLNLAGGVTIDSANTLYFSDTGDHVVRAFTSIGAASTLAGTMPQPGSADGSGAAAQFNGPKGIRSDASGNLYLADTLNHIVRRVTPDGVVSTLAGTAGAQGSTDGSGAAARFLYPHDVAVDASGNLYVADSFNNTIRKVTPAGVVSTLAGAAGQVGSADGSGAAARFNSPQGIAVDAAGNVYVADRWNYTIRKITPDGAVSTLAGTAGEFGSVNGIGSAARFGAPGDMTIDADGNLYLIDSGSTIRKITPTGTVSTLAGSSGQWGDADGNGPAARFRMPEGIGIDAAGNLYVADTGNHAIRRVTPGGEVSTVAGNGETQELAQGSLYRPTGVAVSGDGVLAITAGNGVFRLVLP